MANVHGANPGVRADIYWHIGGFAPLQVDQDVDLVDRSTSWPAEVPIVWDEAKSVPTSDRPHPRAAGGIGDHLHVLAHHHPKPAAPRGTR